MTASTQATLSDIPAIRPAPDPTIVYLGTAVVGEGLVLTYDGLVSDKVDLRFGGPRTSDTTLVIQVADGWLVMPNDPTLAWSNVGPIWVAQVLAPIINMVLDSKPKYLKSSFSFVHPTLGWRSDPIIIIRPEG